MIYPFVCPNGHSMDVMLRMADRNSPQQCAICGELLQRKIATGMAVIWSGVWRDQWRDSPLDRGGLDDGLGPQAEGSIKP